MDFLRSEHPQMRTVIFALGIGGCRLPANCKTRTFSLFPRNNRNKNAVYPTEHTALTAINMLLLLPTFPQAEA